MSCKFFCVSLVHSKWHFKSQNRNGVDCYFPLHINYESRNCCYYCLSSYTYSFWHFSISIVMRDLHANVEFVKKYLLWGLCGYAERHIIHHKWYYMLIYCFMFVLFIFSCDQAALQMVQSVCLSVRPSVHPSVCLSHLFHYGPLIMKFSGLISIDRSDVHAKGRGQSSKVKVTEVKTPLDSFQTVTQFEFNNGYEMMHKARSSIGGVPYCFLRSSVKF